MLYMQNYALPCFCYVMNTIWSKLTVFDLCFLPVFVFFPACLVGFGKSQDIKQIIKLTWPKPISHEPLMHDCVYISINNLEC